VIINPTFNSRLVAATTNGIYTSNDAGATWTQILDSLFWDLIHDPNNVNTLYAATGYLKNANTGYASVMKSIDFGQTWTQLNTGIPPVDSVTRIKLCVAPGNSNIIYALTVNRSRGMYALYKSSNAGTGWVKKYNALNLLDFYDGTGAGGQGTYDLVLMVPPQDTNKVYAGGINIWGSNDGGSSFEPVTNKYISSAPDIHVDQHFLSYHPTTQNVFICNDGGIYRAPILYTTSMTNVQASLPFPTIWSNISAGMQVTSFYRMCSDKSLSNQMIAGAQDNSTYYKDTTGWKNIFGGDGMDNFVDSNGTLIGSSQFGYFNIQNSITPFAVFSASGGEWTSPLIHDPLYDNLFFGGQDVYVSPDFGTTITPISSFSLLSGNFSNEPPITGIAAVGDRLYVTKRPLYFVPLNGYCYTSSNGGATWQNITAGLPDSLYFTSIEAHPINSNIAWVTCAGFSGGIKVFKTTNAGLTWTNASYNLPNIPVNMIKYIDPTNDVIMVACDVGVYYLKGNSTSWQIYNNGLPNVIVSDIEVNTVANKILVSTFGRGIWSSDYSQFINLVSGINQLSKNEVAIYPNPVSDIIYFKNNSVKLINVLDISGKTILSQNNIKNNQVTIKDLASGDYVIQAFDQKNNLIFSHKIIKE
jgi:photosystem II stability/assembly factor-like uncharacterized protein